MKKAQNVEVIVKQGTDTYTYMTIKLMALSIQKLIDLFR